MFSKTIYARIARQVCNRATGLLAALIAGLWLCQTAIAQPTFLMTQNQTLYRFQTSGQIDIFSAPETISGMTTVPAGVNVGNLNGGASGGDVIALGSSGVYRIDTPAATPTFTQIGNRGGPNASPVFANGHLYGIGGVGSVGSVFVEWRLTDFSEISQTSTGVFDGPGGIVHVSGNTFLYSGFVTGQLWEYTIGDNFSTARGPLPPLDYSGLERDSDGTIYASFAQPGSPGQMVFGTIRESDAMFTQLRVIDTYVSGGANGITGLAIIPEPGSVLILGVCGIAARARRQRVRADVRSAA